MSWINLTPAYGRDYKNRKEVLKDFLEGKDFVLNTPFQTTYINLEQIEEGTNIQFRYRKLQSTCVYKVTSNVASQHKDLERKNK